MPTKSRTTCADAVGPEVMVGNLPGAIAAGSGHWALGHSQSWWRICAIDPAYLQGALGLP